MCPYDCKGNVLFISVWRNNGNVYIKSVGDGFPDVPMYKLRNNLYIMANTVRLYIKNATVISKFTQQINLSKQYALL